MIHGWPETKRIWWRNVGPLAAAGFDLIASDVVASQCAAIAYPEHFGPSIVPGAEGALLWFFVDLNAEMRGGYRRALWRRLAHFESGLTCLS